MWKLTVQGTCKGNILKAALILDMSREEPVG
jgi:hypothetical protein